MDASKKADSWEATPSLMPLPTPNFSSLMDLSASSSQVINQIGQNVLLASDAEPSSNFSSCMLAPDIRMSTSETFYEPQGRGSELQGDSSRPSLEGQALLRTSQRRRSSLFSCIGCCDSENQEITPSARPSEQRRSSLPTPPTPKMKTPTPRVAQTRFTFATPQSISMASSPTSEPMKQLPAAAASLSLFQKTVQASNLSKGRKILRAASEAALQSDQEEEGFSPMSVKACRILSLNDEIPRLPPGVLLLTQYQPCVKAILTSKPSDKGYRRIQETLSIYDNLLKANKQKFATFGARQQALAFAARDCLYAMESYQVLFFERRLFEEDGKEDTVLDLHVKKLVSHFEGTYPLQTYEPKHEALNMLLDLAKTKQEMAAALSIWESDKTSLLQGINQLVKTGCSYEEFRGGLVTIEKVRYEISRYRKILFQLITEDPYTFINSFGDDVIISLAFSGHSACKGLHGLIYTRLASEFATENARFIEEYSKYLFSLHEAYLHRKLLEKSQRNAFFKEMKRLYESVIEINIAATERQSMQRELNLQTPLHVADQLSPEAFYLFTSKFLQGSVKAIRMLIQDPVRRYKNHGPDQQRLAQALLNSVTGK